MKAVVFEKYGGPDVLEMRDIEKPIPKHNEVLVKIYSTTVTAGDWRVRSATPFLVRFMAGLFKPTRLKILGFELSGVIEETGADVKTFQKGDRIFASCGFKFGAYAEYKCLTVNDMISLKPDNISFDEAAGIPIGGITALRLLKKAGIKKDDEVLIYGASGSVGTFAVQIGVFFDARVTGVCSTANLDLVKSLGAVQVIDYTKEDFTKIPGSFDIIVDAVGKTSKRACKKILKPGGKYTTVSGMLPKGEHDLLFLKKLAGSGKLKTVIDRIYPLQQIREAHEYVQSFHKKGNVIIKVRDDNG
jgi:NADPH:quinone reductase-like Zn-dependent oxidoreductase